MEFLIFNAVRSTSHKSQSFRSYDALYKFLQPRLLQAALIASTKCDCTLSCCPYSLLYTIGPPDIIGCRYSFGIIRGICNQRGVYFAYTQVSGQPMFKHYYLCADLILYMNLYLVLPVFGTLPIKEIGQHAA